MIPPEEHSEEEAILARLRRGERLAQYETRRRHRDGHDVWVLLTISPIRDKDGAIIGASKIARDLSRLRQTEGSLDRARRVVAMGQLASGVAHDFANLMTIILGNIEELQSLVSASPEAAGLASEILNAASSGAALSHRLLDFTRTHARATRQVNLHVDVPRHIGLIRRVLGKSVRLNVYLAPDLWPTRIDPAQLGDALLNLLLNARDAMTSGVGTIAVEAANVRIFRNGAGTDSDPAGGAYIMLAVADDGAGMSQKILDRVTEPFFTTKLNGEGSGLGMSMVRRFALESGGILLIESLVGVGTIVRIYLPHVDACGDLLSQRAVPDTWACGKETVLIVGGAAHQRAMAVYTLSKLGYRVRSTGDSESALLVLGEDDEVSLILADGDIDLSFVAAAHRLRPKLVFLLAANEFPLDGNYCVRFIGRRYTWENLADSMRLVLDDAAEG